MIDEIHRIISEENIVTKPFIGTLSNSGTGYLYPCDDDNLVTTLVDAGRQGVLVQLTVTDDQGVKRDSSLVIFSRYSHANSIMGFGGDTNFFWNCAISRGNEKKFLARFRKLMRGEQVSAWNADNDYTGTVPASTDTFSLRRSVAPCVHKYDEPATPCSYKCNWTIVYCTIMFLLLVYIAYKH